LSGPGDILTMKTITILSLTAILGLPAAHGGNITGTVHAKGPPEAADPGADDGYQSKRYKYAEKIDYDQLTDFIVYIDQPVAERVPQTKVPVAVTTQKDASFDPHVLAIAVGTTVRWPNEDDIYHNVYSMSDVKSFDLGYYKKDEPVAVPHVVTFDKPGRVDVFCAIHTKMHCIILVVPNSFFAKADAKGRFVIKNVPPGTYKLRAWHERVPGQTLEVVVPAEGDAAPVNITLGLAELPKY
jgi:plastocyanin